MKTLKQIIEKADKPTPSAPIEPDSVTSYVPKTKDEKRFMDKHVVQKTADANKNGDDVFRATNIKAYDRSASHHGYNTKEDQAVYENIGMKTLIQILGEKHLTPAELGKREQIAKAIERKNPGMDKSKKMAIATATAKRVAEDFDQFNEEFQALDEGARHDQYATYHSGVKDMLKKLGAQIDAHKEAANSPTEWNKEKGGNMSGHHVYTMKNMHRTLQDLHDNLQQDVEYAQPPKPVKLKEEVEQQFSLFEDIFGEQAEAARDVYAILSEENRDLFASMIAEQRIDELKQIVLDIGAK